MVGDADDGIVVGSVVDAVVNCGLGIVVGSIVVIMSTGVLGESVGVPVSAIGAVLGWEVGNSDGSKVIAIALGVAVAEGVALG